MSNTVCRSNSWMKGNGEDGRYECDTCMNFSIPGGAPVDTGFAQESRQRARAEAAGSWTAAGDARPLPVPWQPRGRVGRGSGSEQPVAGHRVRHRRAVRTGIATTVAAVGYLRRARDGAPRGFAGPSADHRTRGELDRIGVAPGGRGMVRCHRPKCSDCSPRGELPGSDRRPRLNLAGILASVRDGRFASRTVGTTGRDTHRGIGDGLTSMVRRRTAISAMKHWPVRERRRIWSSMDRPSRCRYQADRNGRKPPPLSVGGRIFLQGLHRLLALDQYNGSVLWSWELPEMDRYNMPRDCGNWRADERSATSPFTTSVGKSRLPMAACRSCWTLIPALQIRAITGAMLTPKKTC